MGKGKEIYLDNAATTKVYEKVADEVLKAFREQYGNPSSTHSVGEGARGLMDKARLTLSKEINAKPWEIIFTSGGTESDNMAIIGAAKANPGKKKIIISSIEHSAVTKSAESLESQGYKIVKIPTDAQGHIRLDILEKEIDGNTLIVSVMHVNNIFGVIQDTEKIARICKGKGVLFHTDAVQSFGKMDIDVTKGIDLLSASAHKIGGPKGIGFLYIREGVRIDPLIYGGGQERGMRSGTENVPGIVGFAKALEIVKRINREKIRKLRDKFIERLQEVGGKINGSLQDRIYNNIHVSFPLVDGGVLVQYLSKKGIFVSAGSACDSRKEKDIESLRALGLTELESKGSIRITLNEDITEKDVDFAAKEIAKAVKKLRI